MFKDDIDTDSESSTDLTGDISKWISKNYNFCMRSDSDEDSCNEEWFGYASVGECKKKLKKFTSLRERLHWEIEEERYEFLRQLYALIGNWRDRLPDLKKFFSRDEMDWLIAEDIMKKRSRYGSRARLVKFVIRTGYKDNAGGDGDESSSSSLSHRTTPIHHADSNKQYGLVSRLFKIYDDFEVNCTDHEGLTHFHVACRAGCQDVVEKFLELSPSPELLVEKSDASGSRLPLHLALTGGHKSVVETLLKHGANPNSTGEYGLTPLHAICRRKHDDDDLLKFFFRICDERDQILQIDARDAFGDAPLHHALPRLVKVAATLLRRRANPNLARKYGQTPLHLVCERFDDTTVDDEVAMFLRTFFEISDAFRQTVQLDAVDGAPNWTPLQWAVSSLLPQAVDVLLARTADDLFSGFVFPTKIYYVEEAEKRICNHYVNWISCNVKRVYYALSVVECLEKRGYAMKRADALIIMKFFDSAFLGLNQNEKDWYDDDRTFAGDAKEQTLRPGLSLYDLVRLRLDEATKLLTLRDYYEFARTSINWLSPCWSTCTPSRHLCQIMSRGFYRRWALESMLELTRQRLPILCCESIIDELANNDLFGICLAAEKDEKEETKS